MNSHNRKASDNFNSRISRCDELSQSSLPNLPEVAFPKEKKGKPRSREDKPKIGKCLSFNVSSDKSLLDILDSVEEIKYDTKDTRFSKCKCCDKVIFNKELLSEHQAKCFQNKIDKLNTKMSLMREDIKHEIRIRGLELLIERNKEKFNRIMNVFVIV